MKRDIEFAVPVELRQAEELLHKYGRWAQDRFRKQRCASAEGDYKHPPVRSEAYRRAVAALPCVICKIAGISQCAHANTGKGAGIKASDLESFPLCACQPGRQGCHSKFDQGALYTKAARRLIEPAWIADTQRCIHTMGQWPKGIPYPHEHIEG